MGFDSGFHIDRLTHIATTIGKEESVDVSLPILVPLIPAVFFNS